jgi:hypothetical protein
MQAANSFHLENERMTTGTCYSGLREVRSYGAATQAYKKTLYDLTCDLVLLKFENLLFSHSTSTVLSIHNHPNLIDLIGMGEFEAVLNGASFRTRHNDYLLVQPALNDKTYHKTR